MIFLLIHKIKKLNTNSNKLKYIHVLNWQETGKYFFSSITCQLNSETKYYCKQKKQLNMSWRGIFMFS
jgi:hypothetical protein